MASVLRSETVPVRSDHDLVTARQLVRQIAIEAGFRLIDQTKVVTAVSELARNTVIHGGGGSMTVEVLTGPSTGLRLTFIDTGPGIADLASALKGGVSTGHGLGLGLSGSKRLMNEFDIETAPGKGTKVTVTKWK